MTCGDFILNFGMLAVMISDAEKWMFWDPLSQNLRRKGWRNSQIRDMGGDLGGLAGGLKREGGWRGMDY